MQGLMMDEPLLISSLIKHAAMNYADKGVVSRETDRDFAACFDFSPSAITRVERGQLPGREILKRAEIYARFSEVALFQLHRHGGVLHTKKYQQIVSKLSKIS